MERYAESNELTGNDCEAINMSGTASPNHRYNLSDITRTLRVTFCRRHNHPTNTNPIPLRSRARYRELF